MFEEPCLVPLDFSPSIALSRFPAQYNKAVKCKIKPNKVEFQYQILNKIV